MQKKEFCQQQNNVAFPPLKRCCKIKKQYRWISENMKFQSLLLLNILGNLATPCYVKLKNTKYNTIAVWTEHYLSYNATYKTFSYLFFVWEAHHFLLHHPLLHHHSGLPLQPRHQHVEPQAEHPLQVLQGDQGSKDGPGSQGVVLALGYHRGLGGAPDRRRERH